MLNKLKIFKTNNDNFQWATYKLYVWSVLGNNIYRVWFNKGGSQDITYYKDDSKLELNINKTITNFKCNSIKEAEQLVSMFDQADNNINISETNKRINWDIKNKNFKLYKYKDQ